MLAVAHRRPPCSLDNRSADRQPQTNSLRLGRVKGLEEVLLHGKLYFPGPEFLRTETSTPPALAFSVVTSSSRGPSRIPVIASMALISQVQNNLLELGPDLLKPAVKVSTSSVCTETPFFAASVRMNAFASRIAALISTGSLRRGLFFARSRTR